MHAKGSSSEKLSIRMRNPCNRQLISIHVRLKFFDSSLRGFFAKNGVPLFKEPLRQLRDVFWVLNQVANPNSTHTNSVFGLTRIRLQLVRLKGKPARSSPDKTHRRIAP